MKAIEHHTQQTTQYDLFFFFFFNCGYLSASHGAGRMLLDHQFIQVLHFVCGSRKASGHSENVVFERLNGKILD